MMMGEDIIKRLREHPDFLELQDYLLSKIEELDSISGLEGLSNEQAGEEVRARSKAKNKLLNILAPFIDYKERKEPTITEIQTAKTKAGF